MPPRVDAAARTPKALAIVELSSRLFKHIGSVAMVPQGGLVLLDVPVVIGDKRPSACSARERERLGFGLGGRLIPGGGLARFRVP